MSAKSVKLPLKVLLATLMLTVLLAGANFMAGALLFLFYKEDPSKAEFLTIERAYLSQPDAAAMKKIKLASAISLLLCLGGPLVLVFMGKRRGNKGEELYGKARFANRKDIEQEKLDGSKGVVIGKFEDKLLRLGWLRIRVVSSADAYR